jgi:very-short-patch-repair endonuclease
VNRVSATREVIDYAKRHGGIITTREALTLGLPQSTLTRRVSDGIFVRMGRGLLVLPGTSTRPDVMMRAAGRLLGAVVSHQSAARIHKMEPIPKSTPSVTVPHRGTHVFPGLIVHQSTDLLPEHVMTVGGLRVTTPPRTILDLAKVLGAKRLERIIDNALAGGIVDFDELWTLYLALTRQGKTGMRKMGTILAERADGKRIPDTVIETKLFELLDNAGIRTPEKQFHAPWLEPIHGRVDFAYPAERIVIEADSRRWHALYDAFEVDRRRDIAAQLAGWIVLRITWKMITEDPGFVINTVQEALVTR